MQSSSTWTRDAIADHGRYWRGLALAYPVISRRSGGLSIGINLNPNRQCNFDCVYCQVDRSSPQPGGAVDMDRLVQDLETIVDLIDSGEIWSDSRFADTPPAQRRWVDIAFSGDGEPTSCPQFADAVARADAMRRRRGRGRVKLVLITNATLLHRPYVQAALAMFGETDEVWAKLDAGDDHNYRMINRSSVSLRRVLANITELGRRRPVVIQTMFCRLHGSAPSSAMLASYADRLAEMHRNGCRIAAVLAYTVAREPMEAAVEPLSDEELSTIAQYLRDRLDGLSVQCYGTMA